MSETTTFPPRKVSLFVTCLADLFRPSVAWASLRLLEAANCKVHVPDTQTCCGQPAYNSGDRDSAIPVARANIALFEDADYVVAPSGSCAAMLRHHYPRLLDGQWRERAQVLASRTYEITQFLHDIVGPTALEPIALQAGSVTYHDSCAGLRELGVQEQPRRLLRERCSVQVKEMDNAGTCCGFGGTFCAKMPAVSAQMADDKLAGAERAGASLLTGGDLGCLLQLAGRARRDGRDLEIRHVVELLAGELDTPGIGDPCP